MRNKQDILCTFFCFIRMTFATTSEIVTIFDNVRLKAPIKHFITFFKTVANLQLS